MDNLFQKIMDVLDKDQPSDEEFRAAFKASLGILYHVVTDIHRIADALDTIVKRDTIDVVNHY